MGRVVHGAKFPGTICPWGELYMGLVAHGVKCPWGELSLGRVVHRASCSWSEFSMGQNWQNDCGAKCHGASFDGASCPGIRSAAALPI